MNNLNPHLEKSSDSTQIVGQTLTSEVIQLLVDECERGKLTSLPKKIEFMKKKGMDSIEDVHAWMTRTRESFVLFCSRLPKDIK